MAEIADILKQLGKNNEEIYSVVCTVTEIDEEKRIISVKPNNNSAEVFDVRLQTVVSGALGLVYFPKMSSEVIITFLSKELAYVALYSEIEKVQLNIGDFSLFFDATNANLSSENIDVIATNTEIRSDNIKVNATSTEINSDNVTVNATNTETNSQTTKFLSSSFEVEGTSVKITAPSIALMGAAINLTGAVTIAGATAINGAITINGGGNGGLPLGGALVSQLNSLKTDISNLKQKFNNWTPSSNDGGAALKSQLAGWSPNVTPVTAAAISNPQITQ
ncbi:structural protein [Flavobacterium phage vB_FspM_lotta8-2]|uniref:Structural protein n=1 Tax=Flavobacterium phage vB_FspM_lotta8-2 TaxID=2686243 RepID=A0A6B9LKN4_9CAUD|nr:structural protein [Flavobacterium phage vB_FspM_lotta8-2]